jgi:hypothetical protein
VGLGQYVLGRPSVDTQGTHAGEIFATKQVETSMATDYAPPNFDDRTVRLITSSLPEAAIPERVESLSAVLQDWANNELRAYFSRESSADIKKRAERVELVGNRARDLLKALDSIDGTDMWEVAQRMPREETCHWPKMKGHHLWRWSKTKRFVQRIVEEKDFLDALTVAASEAWRRKRGQPPNIISYLVIKDIAAIFEWCTELPATRQVDRATRQEGGGFHLFAAAIWPVVFGQGDDGLSAAIKKFAKYRNREGRALMANIKIRHPEWKVFEAPKA